MDVKNVSPNGFKVLPVKFNSASRAVNYLYCKEHIVRNDLNDQPEGRTLFVIDVLPYIDEVCLTKLFSSYGKVEKVTFRQQPSQTEADVVSYSKYFPKVDPIKGCKVAFVAFKKPTGLINFLRTKFNEPLELSTTEKPLVTGLKKWCKRYNDSIPNAEEMQKEINDFLAEYDAKVEQQLQKEKESEGIPDEDGWIKVTKQGRRPVIPRTEAQGRKISEKEKKKRSQKELLNFYTFQMRETKMNQIVELRKKFEEDKNRIALQKASRRFKPF